MADFVKFEINEALKQSQNSLLEKVKKKGKIKVGVNEVTKAIERGTAKFVVIAKDVSPAEIVMHIPILCKEKNVAFSYADSKKELGEKISLPVGTSAIAIVDDGDMKKEFEDLANKIKALNK